MHVQIHVRGAAESTEYIHTNGIALALETPNTVYFA